LTFPQQVADQLHVQRIGQRHQAGSDALLTGMAFFKLRELFFADNWKEVLADLLMIDNST
jgi:CCR4-NOT transcription complex subunit 7/8